MSGSPLLIASTLPTLCTWHTQLQRETEALGRQAAQLRGSNKGLQTKLDAQREELTGRMRSAVSITMQVGAQQCRLCHEIVMAMPRQSEVQPPRWEWHMQLVCSDQQPDMYPLVLGAMLEAYRNNCDGGPQAREALQKEKEQREAAAASVEQVRSEYMQVKAQQCRLSQ
jgi:predicted  nucleic acid-binding Zn-ribbon protein